MMPRLTTFLAVLCISSTIANAATFCGIQGSARNCWYGSLESCQRAVGSNGTCVMNQDEAARQSGSAPFCAASGSSPGCHYWDYQSCVRTAERTGGKCEPRR
jgi:hypothetical protein